MPVHDVVALHTALLNLAVKCYTENMEYVDKVLENTEAVLTSINLDQYVMCY